MESPLWKLMNDVLAKDNTFMLTPAGVWNSPNTFGAGQQSDQLADLKGKRVRIVS